MYFFSLLEHNQFFVHGNFNNKQKKNYNCIILVTFLKKINHSIVEIILFGGEKSEIGYELIYVYIFLYIHLALSKNPN